MLRLAKSFKKFRLRARNGDIGKAREFYFNDENWTIRYLVADTGDWLSGRWVLISPHALDPADEEDRVIPVDLTRKQIEQSPSLASDQPVSRQFEMEYYGYYGWPIYWEGPFVWGPTSFPGRHLALDRTAAQEKADEIVTGDPHLRSTQEVTGYHLQALDGEIGHIADFIIDDETWMIRYLVIDTKNWWPGRHVLISPQWIERVSWRDSKVFVNLSRDTVRHAPEYLPETLDREYEVDLHRHYDRSGYWADEPAGHLH